MRKPTKFWIKERHNPQLGTYYVGCGAMSVRNAKIEESPLYGVNIMHEYPDEKSYKAKLAELKARGETVQ